mmetsp:Transcript_58610/g.96759  ORF Transcript_58610/g.96759 Transcript_58610/m.96759 type:complete len:86 (-) Transcript_58610:4-261(-)
MRVLVRFSEFSSKQHDTRTLASATSPYCSDSGINSGSSSDCSTDGCNTSGDESRLLANRTMPAMASDYGTTEQTMTRAWGYKVGR